MEGLVMIYATISRHALKGQKLLAQGNTLGIHGRKPVALKGQKLSINKRHERNR